MSLMEMMQQMMEAESGEDGERSNDANIQKLNTVELHIDKFSGRKAPLMFQSYEDAKDFYESYKTALLNGDKVVTADSAAFFTGIRYEMGFGPFALLTDSISVMAIQASPKPDLSGVRNGEQTVLGISINEIKELGKRGLRDLYASKGFVHIELHLNEGVDGYGFSGPSLSMYAKSKEVADQNYKAILSAIQENKPFVELKDTLLFGDVTDAFRTDVCNYVVKTETIVGVNVSNQPISEEVLNVING